MMIFPARTTVWIGHLPTQVCFLHAKTKIFTRK